MVWFHERSHSSTNKSNHFLGLQKITTFVWYPANVTENLGYLNKWRPLSLSSIRLPQKGLVSVRHWLESCYITMACTSQIGNNWYTMMVSPRDECTLKAPAVCKVWSVSGPVESSFPDGLGPFIVIQSKSSLELWIQPGHNPSTASKSHSRLKPEQKYYLRESSLTVVQFNWTCNKFEFSSIEHVIHIFQEISQQTWFHTSQNLFILLTWLM